MMMNRFIHITLSVPEDADKERLTMMIDYIETVAQTIFPCNSGVYTWKVEDEFPKAGCW